MRVVFDTNIFVAALLTPGGTCWQLYDLWRSKHFTLISSQTQLNELRRVSRYEKLRDKLKPHQVGSFVNIMRREARLIVPEKVEVLS